MARNDETQVPDNTRPPRRMIDPDPRPTLGVRAIMRAVQDLARAKGLDRARVAYKLNRQGDHVIALILPNEAKAGEAGAHDGDR